VSSNIRSKTGAESARRPKQSIIISGFSLLGHSHSPLPLPPLPIPLDMGSTVEAIFNNNNETLLFDRFLIMYDLCVFTCIIFIFFVFHCTHVRMSYVLNSYLLTYLHFPFPY